MRKNPLTPPPCGPRMAASRRWSRVLRTAIVSLIVITLLLHETLCGQLCVCDAAREIECAERVAQAAPPCPDSCPDGCTGKRSVAPALSLPSASPIALPPAAAYPLDHCTCHSCSHDFILRASLMVLFSNPGVITVPMPYLPLPARPAPAERRHAQPGLPPAGYRQFDPTALILRC